MAIAQSFTRLFFTKMWDEYIKITPQAKQIKALFLQQGEAIVNDHIAIRTFDLAPISIKKLSPLITQLGYQLLDHYIFKEKHLYAESYIDKKGLYPRIFISEFKTSFLNKTNQKLIQYFCQQITKQELQNADIFFKGRLWKMPSWQNYQELLEQSEYAAWLSVMGLRANHFTISVNHLKHYDSLSKVNQLLLDAGFKLNNSGGLIKGSAKELLEQSATLASHINMQFAGGDIHQISSCYYEFAKRYLDHNKRLFEGFVSQSADKIFESTDSLVIGRK
ncbi:MAG: DUF1338 domain-containing protein [Pseudomonadota bacterium]